MLRQNTGFMDGFYGLPSGHVELYETPVGAIIREAQEESVDQILRLMELLPVPSIAELNY